MAFYSLGDIRYVHLELSSLCNAECPLCPRNFHGYPYNFGYVERNLTLDNVRTIFTPEFIQQLTELNINGNFGDMVMNPETLNIIQYFRQHNQTLKIGISTNGGARPAEFWRNLAELNCYINFCLDGLEDTHSKYRRNTLYSTVIKNAQTFIQAGGRAAWVMIKFAHNQHQLNTAELISKQLGFQDFYVVDVGRNTAPVFDHTGQLIDKIGNPTETEFLPMLARIQQQRWNSTTDVSVHSPIECWAKKNQSIYITSTGEVYPCCWTGFNPRTFNNSEFMGEANRQITNLLKDNSAIERPLADCINWFDQIEESWANSTYSEGRLIMCQTQCGQCK